MKLSPAVLDAMLAAGCTAEQIVAAVKAAAGEQDQVAAERRERDRLRKRTERAAKKEVQSRVASDLSEGQTWTRTDGADAPPPSLDKKAPQTPKELNPSAPASPAPTRGEFDQFWTVFPNKVGKADAVKAFGKARQRVDFETLMAGLRRYVGKTDDRPWCNPATWLNQERWDDEPATVARAGPAAKTVGGMQSMFGQMREHIENGQGNGSGGDWPSRAPVLSLPNRRAG